MVHSLSFHATHTPKNTKTPPHTLTYAVTFPFLAECMFVTDFPCCRGNSDQLKLNFYIFLYSNSLSLLQLQK